MSVRCGLQSRRWKYYVTTDMVTEMLNKVIYSIKIYKKFLRMALCSLKLLIHCKFGYYFMSDSAVLQTLKYSAYSCVPICTDSTFAKANTGPLPVILPRHRCFSCIYGMGVLIVS